MSTVQQLLSTKPDQVYSVHPDASVLEALQVMMEKNISALLVKHEGVLVGIFTERDYARKIVLYGKTSSTTTIAEVMTGEMVTVGPQHTIEDCMKMMTDRRIRHLPVVLGEELKGIVSIGDVVKFIIQDQKQTIDALQSYIHG